MNEFEGRVAAITGGGRGFGKAFGRALAERGAAVYLLDIDRDAASEAAAELSASGLQVRPLYCDVADENQVETVIDSMVQEQGGIDIFINNAGLHSAAYSLPMADMGLDKIRRLFEVNVMGVVICSLAARPAMAGRPGAAIVNISSSAAYVAGRAYGVSKLAVRGLTVDFARDFAQDGIRVNGIAPGLIFTETIRNELSEESVQGVMRQQILQREGEEQDIVNAMLYLVSSQSSFVTGETLKVTGGYTVSV